MVIILISPRFDDIKLLEDERGFKDCLESFHSSVWEQGSRADERVMERYGKYSVALAIQQESKCITGDLVFTSNLSICIIGSFQDCYEQLSLLE